MLAGQYLKNLLALYLNRPGVTGAVVQTLLSSNNLHSKSESSFIFNPTNMKKAFPSFEIIAKSWLKQYKSIKVNFTDLNF